MGAPPVKAAKDHLTLDAEARKAIEEYAAQVGIMYDRMLQVKQPNLSERTRKQKAGECHRAIHEALTDNYADCIKEINEARSKLAADEQITYEVKGSFESIVIESQQDMTRAIIAEIDSHYAQKNNAKRAYYDHHLEMRELLKNLKAGTGAAGTTDAQGKLTDLGRDYVTKQNRAIRLAGEVIEVSASQLEADDKTYELQALALLPEKLLNPGYLERTRREWAQAQLALETEERKSESIRLAEEKKARDAAGATPVTGGETSLPMPDHGSAGTPGIKEKEHDPSFEVFDQAKQAVRDILSGKGNPKQAEFTPILPAMPIRKTTGQQH